MSEKTEKPVEAAKSKFENAEARVARAAEGLVGSNSFGEVLSFVTGNTSAIVRKGGGLADTVVRTLRIAGRRDVATFGHQLARTEDKLERVLQEIETLQGEVRGNRGTAKKGASR